MADGDTTAQQPTSQTSPGGQNQTDGDIASLAIKALQDLVVAANGMTQTLTNAPT